MPEPVKPECPSCGGFTLVRHCPDSTYCHWDKCSDPECASLVDRRNRKHTHRIGQVRCNFCGSLHTRSAQ